jgi:hypothetical protein
LITLSNSEKAAVEWDAFANSAKSSRPTPAFSASTTASNGLKDITLNRSISDLLIDIASSFYQIVTFELTEVRLREATHKQFRSRDIAGIVGCEKHHGLANSSGFPIRPSGTTVQSTFRRCCPVPEEASSSLLRMQRLGHSQFAERMQLRIAARPEFWGITVR